MIATILKPLVDIATAAVSLFNQMPGPIKTAATALGLFAAGVIAANVALATFKGLAATTLGTQIATQVTQFVGAFTKVNLAATLSSWAGGIGAVATSLKGALVGAMASATTGLTGLWTAMQAITWSTIKSGAIALGTAIKGAVVAGFTALKGAVAAAGASLVAAAPAMAAFVAAAAPFVAIGAGVAAIIIAIKRNMDAYKSVADPLAKSQETLNKSLEPTKTAAEGNANAWKSWGDRLTEFLGPFGKVLEFVMPVYKGIKLVLNILGEVDRINKNSAAIRAANDAYNTFQQGIDKGNGIIQKNMDIIRNGTPGTEAYGAAIAENEKIIRGQSSALGERITALDATIKKMEEEEGFNSAAIQKLQELRQKYVDQKVAIDANKDAIINMRKETEAITGKTNDYIQAIDDANEARRTFNERSTAQSYYTEIQAMEDLKAGLINEEEARGRNALQALQIANDKIGYVNDEVDAIEEARKRGLINEDQYEQRMAEATDGIQDTLKDREAAEKELADATKAAIDRRLGDMANEVSQIEQNAQRVQTALQSIFSVQGSGIGALKGLVNEITNLEITKADQVKNKRIKAIDDEERRRIQAIERSGLSDEQKARAKEALEKKFQRDRDAAERAFEAKKKAAIAEQIRLQNQINQAAYAGKQAELTLWYETQRIQLEIQRVQAEIDRAKAEAAGDDAAVAAYEKQINLIGELQNQLPTMYNLKKDILDIENDTNKVMLANKGAANDINTSFLGTIPTLGDVRTKLGEITGTAQSMADGLEPFKTSINEIPTDVDGVVQQVRDNINGINEVTFDGLVRHFEESMGLSTAAAEREAGKIVTWYDTAGQEAGNIAATNIYERFGDTIPAPLIKDQLIKAFQEGSGLSLKEAEAAYQNLGSTIPKDDVVEILGNAFGEGAEDGVEILRNTPIPDAMNIFGGGIQTGITQQGDEGQKNILQKIVEGTGDAAKAIGNWFLYGFDGGIEEQKKALKTMGDNIEGDTRTQDAIRDQVQTGYDEGSKDGADAIASQMQQGAQDGVGEMISTIQGNSEKIAEPIGKSIQNAVTNAANSVKEAVKTGFDDIKEKAEGLADAIKTDELEKKMKKALIDPANDAKSVLEGLKVADGVESSMEAAGTAAKDIASSDIDGIFRDVATQSRTGSSNARSMASSVRSAVGPANSFARAMERAARAAERAARARWSGGPVQGGQTYTVNELGREMFMSNTGSISEIKAPAYGKWRAPSSGTVIPAHIAQQIRDQREAAKVANAASSISNTTSITGGAASNFELDGGGITGAIKQGFKGVSSGGGSVVNNVTMQSARPVVDASRILTDLARIRAQRRR